MKFKDFPYKRPNLNEVSAKFEGLLKRFNEVNTFEAQNEAMKEINALRSEVESMAQIAYIRHTIDTTDKFYEEEQNFFDEVTPLYEGLIIKYYRALVNSKFKNELEEKWGKQIFTLAELTLKTFSPE
ncbi:MAG TPA: M3 family oligoendopeptidase, partial [Clostridiaceae bacterium]|nr:M3 family oligoendopeptidase [Clostridiaceae bacterium]